jgi:hypothetical protein
VTIHQGPTQNAAFSFAVTRREIVGTIDKDEIPPGPESPAPRKRGFNRADRDSSGTNSVRGRLLAAAPLIALLERLAAEHRSVTSRAPNSDFASILASLRSDLSRAIDAARKIDLWATVEQLHDLTGKPTSTLTRMCRKHGATIGAHKSEGLWMIDLPVFTNYLNNLSITHKEEAA